MQATCDIPGKEPNNKFTQQQLFEYKLAYFLFVDKLGGNNGCYGDKMKINKNITRGFPAKGAADHITGFILKYEELHHTM